MSKSKVRGRSSSYDMGRHGQWSSWWNLKSIKACRQPGGLLSICWYTYMCPVGGFLSLTQCTQFAKLGVFWEILPKKHPICHKLGVLGQTNKETVGHKRRWNKGTRHKGTVYGYRVLQNILHASLCDTNYTCSIIIHCTCSKANVLVNEYTNNGIMG